MSNHCVCFAAGGAGVPLPALEQAAVLSQHHDRQGHAAPYSRALAQLQSLQHSSKHLRKALSRDGKKCHVSGHWLHNL